MPKKLKVWLPDDWANISNQNPEGPLTLAWKNAASTGAFQVSTAQYTGGRKPQPSESDLTELAIGFGKQQKWGKLTSSRSGKCMMGAFGTAAFKRKWLTPRNAPAYCQVWFISNGLDFILATFIAMQEPHDQELADAQRIAEAIDFR